MNILVFSPYYPPHTGGLESHSHDFNEHFSKKEGYQVTVFTPQLPPGAPLNECSPTGVKIIRYPSIELIHNYPVPAFWSLIFWRQWKKISNGNYHIIISRTRFFFSSLIAWWYSSTRHKTWMHVEHGSAYTYFKNPLIYRLGKLYDNSLGYLVLKSANIVVANSDASRKFVKKISGRNDCHVIYRGIDQETIENIPPARRKDGKIQILFVGRLIQNKGVDQLLKALSLLPKTLTFECLIIGSGPQLIYLKRLAQKLKIDKNISFLGQKNFSETITLMKSADIFINPSYGEGIPTTVIEAALCGPAIIATNVGGTSEIITGNDDGILISAPDPKELSKKIELLATNKFLRIKISQTARERVLPKFNWNESINNYIKIMSEFNNKKPNIYFLSSRHGGPFKQHQLIGAKLKIRGYMVEHRYDLSGWIKAHFLYGNTKIITNVPLLFRLHKKGFLFNIKGNYRKERNLKRNPLGYLYSLNKLWSERIILPSRFLKERLAIEDALIIPNGIEPKEGSLIDPEDTNGIVLLCVTMFGFREKSEGVLKMLIALSQVKTDTSVHLKIFGKGSYEEEIKLKASELIFPKNISYSFEGYSKNIEEEYKKAHIFVYWSDLDVMPNVFLEAMSYGLPIIANNFPSFYDILGKDNPLVSSSDEFSEKLKIFITSKKERIRVRNSNLERIKGFYLDNLIQEWEKILKL